MTTQERIYALLQEGKYAAQIAKLLHISPSAVSQHIKKMHLTPVKFQSVYKAYELNDKLNSAHIPKSEALSLRLHRFQRSYKLLYAPSEAQLRGLKLNRINNTDPWIGAGFRITSQHLELEGMELISDPRLPAAILEGFAITAADNLAERLASHYGLVIAKDGQTPPKLTEFELNATQMTERMERKGLIELVSKEGYKVWVDWSFGIGGLESNKTLYIQKLTTFANDLVEQDMWELMKAR